MASLTPQAIKYIVVHTSATRMTLDIGADEINQWHIDRGWKGIGYHGVIRRNGVLEAGRPLDVVGAHAYGYNLVSWGICLVGGLDLAGRAEDNYTVAQHGTLRTLLYALHQLAPQAEVLGHRDLSPDVDGDGVIEPWEWTKECPCFDVRKWYTDYKVEDRAWQG